jgi:hypothetical protein
MKNTMLLLIISLMLPACGKKEAPAAPAPVVAPAPEAAPAAPAAAPAEEKK